MKKERRRRHETRLRRNNETRGGGRREKRTNGERRRRTETERKQRRLERLARVQSVARVSPHQLTTRSRHAFKKKSDQDQDRHAMIKSLK